MRIRIRQHSTRLLAGVITFFIGVVVTLLWVIPRVPIKQSQEVLMTPTRIEVVLPDGWEKLDFDNQVVVMLPPDMKPAKLLGDNARYTEAYSNREIHVTMIGDRSDPDFKDKLRNAKLYSCDWPEFLTKHPTYTESLVEIDGRQARLGIARGKEFGGISARICFPGADGDAFDLLIAALCRDDRALVTARQIFSSVRFKK